MNPLLVYIYTCPFWILMNNTILLVSCHCLVSGAESRRARGARDRLCRYRLRWYSTKQIQRGRGKRSHSEPLDSKLFWKVLLVVPTVILERVMQRSVYLGIHVPCVSAILVHVLNWEQMFLYVTSFIREERMATYCLYRGFTYIT